MREAAQSVHRLRAASADGHGAPARMQATRGLVQPMCPTEADVRSNFGRVPVRVRVVAFDSSLCALPCLQEDSEAAPFFLALFDLPRWPPRMLNESF